MTDTPPTPARPSHLSPWQWAIVALFTGAPIITATVIVGQACGLWYVFEWVSLAKDN